MSQEKFTTGSEQIDYTTDLIREVFTYAHRFKSAIFVLKIEDELLADPLFPLLIKDISLVNKMGIKIIVIPGIRSSIEKWLAKENIKTQFNNQIRITSAEALHAIKLASASVVDGFFSRFLEYGVESATGTWVRAQEMGVVEGVDYQWTGKVDSIKKEGIFSLLEKGIVPIISNIGWGSKGLVYNVSSNEVAMVFAKQMQAAKLFFIGSSDGICKIDDSSFPDVSVHSNNICATLDLSQAKYILQNYRSKFSANELQALNCAIQVCEQGVDRVHILKGSVNGSFVREVFSSLGRGTMIQKNTDKNIRKATKDDIPHILNLMDPYIQADIILHRTAADISKQLDDFYVYVVDETIYSCGALCFFLEDQMAELQSVIVNPIYKRKGVGRDLVEYLIEKAKQKKVKSILALTVRSGDFFNSLGFKLGTLEQLPKQRSYNPNRNSKIFIKNLI